MESASDSADPSGSGESQSSGGRGDPLGGPQGPDQSDPRLDHLVAVVARLEESLRTHGQRALTPDYFFWEEVAVPRFGSHLARPLWGSVMEFERAMDKVTQCSPLLEEEGRVQTIEGQPVSVRQAREALRTGLSELLTKKPTHRLVLPFPAVTHRFDHDRLGETVTSLPLRVRFHLDGVVAAWKTLAWDLCDLWLPEGLFWLSAIDHVVTHYHLFQKESLRTQEVSEMRMTQRPGCHAAWTGRVPRQTPPPRQ